MNQKLRTNFPSLSFKFISFELGNRAFAPSDDLRLLLVLLFLNDVNISIRESLSCCREC